MGDQLFGSSCDDDRFNASATTHRIPPNRIGENRLVRLIAQGGMGRVYEARQESLDRLIAIKVLTRRVSPHNFDERFHREAKATAKLNHPNIVSAFDYGVDDGWAWLAMPLIDGFSLDQVSLVLRGDSYPNSKMHAAIEALIPPPPMRAAWIADIGAQVCSALTHAHEHGVIHRDVKPGNLILDSSGKVWVTDFGLSKLTDDRSGLSVSGELIGTPGYMAPEQATGKTEVRSDLYSLGITLWELACERLPYQSADRTSGEQCDFQLPEIQTLKPRLPRQLANVIDRSCAFSPDERYQSADELEYVLRQVAKGRNVADRRRTPRDAKTRPYLRRSFLFPALIAAGLAGALSQSLRMGGATSLEDPKQRPTGVQTAPNEFSILENDRFIAHMPSLGPQATISGIDGHLLEFDAERKLLAFKQQPDFERPVDHRLDNTYEISIDDSQNPKSSTRDLLVRVKNVDEPATIPGLRGNVLRQRMRVGTRQAKFPKLKMIDPESRVCSLAISGGADAERFSIAGDSQLYANQPLEARDKPYRLFVSILDRPATDAMSIEFDKQSKTFSVSSVRNGIDQNIGQLDGVDFERLIQFSSIDGRTLFFAQTATDDRIEFWRLTLNSDLTLDQCECLNRDTGLPPGTKGMATHDCEKFYFFGTIPPVQGDSEEESLKAPVYCRTAELNQDGSFELSAELVSLGPSVKSVDWSNFVTCRHIMLNGIDEYGIDTTWYFDRVNQELFEMDDFVSTRKEVTFWPIPTTGANETEVRLLIDVVAPVEIDMKGVPARSARNATKSKSVAVVNDSLETLDLLWRGFDGRIRHHAKIDIGQYYVVETFVGHIWELRNGDGVLRDAFIVEEHRKVQRIKTIAE